MAFEPIGSLIEPRGPEALNAHKMNSGRWGGRGSGRCSDGTVFASAYLIGDAYEEEKNEKFLKELLETPSPTGNEEPVAALVGSAFAMSQMRFRPTPWDRFMPCSMGKARVLRSCSPRIWMR